MSKQLGEHWVNKSLSHGTMITEDVFDNIRSYGILSKDIIKEFEAAREDEDEEAMSMILNEDVWDYLNGIVPDRCYFGAIEGDGCDYGFWEIMEDEDEEDDEEGEE